jgi:REP element-mobilizing transposase RayT
MVSRRTIVKGPQYVHVISRCHDRNFFFMPTLIKIKVLFLFAKYARKYGIKVFEFIIMDNHFHFLLWTPDADALSNFMRTVNSQIATSINKHFGRDSQALRERFKSPVVIGPRYFAKVMQYIWLNRKEVDRKNNPKQDIFNSISWRLNGQAPVLSDDPEVQELFDNMLRPYDPKELEFPKNILKFIRGLFNEGIKALEEIMQPFLENYHTIADRAAFDHRQELMNAHRRQQAPPGYTCMPNKSSPLRST